MKFTPRPYERQILRKITYQNRNQYITMCPCIKLTLEFWKDVTGKDFEKANIKIVTRIQQCTPAPNFRWFQDVSGRS